MILILESFLALVLPVITLLVEEQINCDLFAFDSSLYLLLLLSLKTLQLFPDSLCSRQPSELKLCFLVILLLKDHYLSRRCSFFFFCFDFFLPWCWMFHSLDSLKLLFFFSLTLLEFPFYLETFFVFSIWLTVTLWLVLILCGYLLYFSVSIPNFMFVYLLQYLRLFFCGFALSVVLVRWSPGHSLQRTMFWQEQAKLKDLFSSLSFLSLFFLLESIFWLRLPFVIRSSWFTIDRVQKNRKQIQFLWLKVCWILVGYLKF